MVAKVSEYAKTPFNDASSRVQYSPLMKIADVFMLQCAMHYGTESNAKILANCLVIEMEE